MWVECWPQLQRLQQLPVSGLVGIQGACSLRYARQCQLQVPSPSCRWTMPLQGATAICVHQHKQRQQRLQSGTAGPPHRQQGSTSACCWRMLLGERCNLQYSYTFITLLQDTLPAGYNSCGAVGLGTRSIQIVISRFARKYAC